MKAMQFASDRGRKQEPKAPQGKAVEPMLDRSSHRNEQTHKQLGRNEKPNPAHGTKVARDLGTDHKLSPNKARVNPKEGQMFRTKTRNQKGFTLIELMIVVVIIGILAALAIPRFMRATTKSKQSEAKQVLKQIYTMQHAYRQEYNAYALNGTTASAVAAQQANFGRIGVDIMATARYTYTIVAAAATFTATATSNVLDDDAAPDVWTIDENGNLVCTSDDALL
jgi:prepilin-type N-terminal cleavage/methylation domain-containing protein